MGSILSCARWYLPSARGALHRRPFGQAASWHTPANARENGKGYLRERLNGPAFQGEPAVRALNPAGTPTGRLVW